MTRAARREVADHAGGDLAVAEHGCEGMAEAAVQRGSHRCAMQGVEHGGDPPFAGVLSEPLGEFFSDVVVSCRRQIWHRQKTAIPKRRAGYGQVQGCRLFVRLGDKTTGEDVGSAALDL
jgi:hypothetical protein